jgi:hypothetical protein
MASNITVDTLTKGSTTLNTDEIVDTNSSQICKAWVNFNGAGTVAIRDSFNVSSITDNGTGVYTINYSTTMSNSNYATVVGSDVPGNSHTGRSVLYSRSTTSIRLYTSQSSGGYDGSDNNIAIFSN